LTLLNTAFDLDSKFGVISQASNLKDESSTTKLYLQKSFGTTATQSETDKWEDYVGSKVRVFNDDFSVLEEVTITGIDPVLNDVLNVNCTYIYT
jgi:poly(A) polymerase Pap1